jgi:L-proline amide hydrolase
MLETWFRITGEIGTGIPLVCLHGGPGCTHDYIDSLVDLARPGRPVIHYDQIGNGRSTHRRDAGSDFWTVELFLAELDNLLAHLGIADRYDLYGQSWGGMLAAEHAVRRPPGLRRLVIANSPASMATWVREANRLRSLLPPDVQTTLALHEAAGTIAAPDYIAAARVFYDRHVCRIPWPPEVARTFSAIDDDPTVYHAMNGPTEFHVVGTLRDWTIEDRVGRIAVETLVISGRYDEATELCVRPYVEGIETARWVVFEESSHMPHVEERAKTMAVIAEFLDPA